MLDFYPKIPLDFSSLRIISEQVFNALRQPVCECVNKETQGEMAAFGEGLSGEPVCKA